MPMWQWTGTHGWGWMGGMMLFGGLFWLILLVLIVAAAAWYARRRGGTSWADRPSGSAIFDGRYARGEIGRDEYLEKKRDLGD